MARLSLPAGAYWIYGKVVAQLYDDGQTSAAVVCGVRLGLNGDDGAAQLEDEGIARIARPLDIQDTLSVSDVVNLGAAAAVVLTCSSGVTGTDSGDPHVAYATRVRLIAVPLDNVNVQPGLGTVP